MTFKKHEKQLDSKNLCLLFPNSHCWRVMALVKILKCYSPSAYIPTAFSTKQQTDFEHVSLSQVYGALKKKNNLKRCGFKYWEQKYEKPINREKILIDHSPKASLCSLYRHVMKRKLGQCIPKVWMFRNLNHGWKWSMNCISIMQVNKYSETYALNFKHYLQPVLIFQFF